MMKAGSVLYFKFYKHIISFDLHNKNLKLFFATKTDFLASYFSLWWYMTVNHGIAWLQKNKKLSPSIHFQLSFFNPTLKKNDYSKGSAKTEWMNEKAFIICLLFAKHCAKQKVETVLHSRRLYSNWGDNTYKKGQQQVRWKSPISKLIKYHL